MENFRNHKGHHKEEYVNQWLKEIHEKNDELLEETNLQINLILRNL
jgi:hypothetical protein